MFFRTESLKDFFRYYPVVSGIIIIQVVIWLLMYFETSLGFTILNEGIGMNALVGQGEYWRLVTPIFLHDWQGITHILFNSFALALFGPALEQMLGKVKFVILYLGAGIFANVFDYLIAMDSTTLSLGASGAIYGMLGLIVYMIFFTPGLIDPASRQLVLTYVMIGLVMTFIQANVSIPGHVFGLIGGFSFGPLLVNNVNPYRRPRPRPRRTHHSGVNFDPNRWQKRRRFKMNGNVSAILWWVLLILAVIGFIAPVILPFLR